MASFSKKKEALSFEDQLALLQDNGNTNGKRLLKLSKKKKRVHVVQASFTRNII
jgi:hypothetical protein